MGLFDNLKNQVNGALGSDFVSKAGSAISGAADKAGNAIAGAVGSVVGKGTNRTETITLAALPKNLSELQALPEASLDTPFKTAALTLAALCAFEQDPDAVYEMLDFLKGPESVSNMEKQFLQERLAGKFYKPFSFFDGATVDNSYKPTTPYTVKVSENPYSFDNENWAVLYVQSAGADSPRPIKFRKKPSTRQWFLNEIQCLSDIRIPTAEDPWA